MNSYAIFANGIYWGIWPAQSAEEAMHDAAHDEGTDGNTAGIIARLITDADEKALQQWVEDNCPAGKFPIHA
jgi:hypothetical protein